MEYSLFKDNLKSYLIILILGILAGISVIFFSSFPSDDLWAFSYFSSGTLGFWMFSTSLIVLFSEKRKTGAINAIIYIFVIFLMTEIYKSFRTYLYGYATYNSLLELSLNSLKDWLEYSIIPAPLGGILAFILWNGRKENLAGKILRILPTAFILLETISLFYTAFVNHTKLFPEIIDLVCLILYIIVIRKYSISKI